ncbi:hypothetical protein [Fibrella aquatica]|uniref:hypothetical protein n=1 Tax=Fibrella aquatica TaxID=3242487 RepID=UPI00351FF9D0
MQAIDALNEIYDSQLKSAKKYAEKETADQDFVDRKYNELDRFFASLKVLKKYNFDSFWSQIIVEIQEKKMSGLIKGVILKVDFEPGDIQHEYFEIKLYVRTTH